MLFSSKKKGNGSPTGAAKETAKAAKGKALGSRPQQGQGPARQPAGAQARGSDPVALSSTLNSHLIFEGDLRYSGTVLVDCEFHGSIVTDDTLLVGESGRVDADICAGVIEISGKVNGNVKAMNHVKILSGGEVRGNIETPTISMEEGVLFEGNCTRAKPQPPPQRPVQQQARREQPPASASPAPAPSKSPEALEKKQKQETSSAVPA